ncbi:MAG TPA: hypothetical protein VF458_23360 [Ktedonobacteraceae bacterium]
MNTPDDFFQPEKIDEQIERLRREPLAANADAELIAYLRSSSGIDAAQEREALNRMWARIASNAPGIQQQPWKGTITPMYEQQTLRSNMPSQKQRGPRGRRLGLLAAVLFVALLVGGMAVVFNAVRGSHGGGPAGPGATPAGTSSAATQTAATFKVTSVTMAVSPASIAGMSCGSNATVKYIATFHVPANTKGGTVQFGYTVNNGRSSTPASLTFAAGETTKSYSFTWSGALPADHTYPSQGGVQVTSPNQLTSPLVGPSGTCSPQAAFKVLSIGMSVSPSSLVGLRCGSSLLVTYKATFHVAANSPGGTVHFQYTINNGRGSTPASLTFAPGQTTKTFTFTWSGSLPADHTYPSLGGVMTSSPNAVNSPLIQPTGQCS